MAKKSILLMDGDQKFLDHMTKSLEDSGFAVQIAKDGLAGLQMVKEDTPSAAIISGSLPRCNGFIVTRLLKFDENYKMLPIILVADDESDKALAGQMGADVFLIKNNAEDFISEQAKKITD
ncbi:MAG: response regulator [Candidatus Margulisiibacteriota bacterium]|jgi:two-component system copper resistance phosphate regulon response regulator CusR